MYQLLVITNSFMLECRLFSFFGGVLSLLEVFNICKINCIVLKLFILFQDKRKGPTIYCLTAFKTKLAVTSPTAPPLQTTIITINPKCLKYDSRGFLSSKLNSFLK